MRKLFILATLAMLTITAHAAKTKTATINVIQTSDVHGCFFPWDFINKRPMKGTLARLSTYVNRLRNENEDGVILLENGDILQGQPINYYYNYTKPDKQNIASKCVNYLKYDIQNWGNHDVETGHDCYDKWGKELICPVLGANVIDNNSQSPYLIPYHIIQRKGVSIAVIGLLTAAIPNWLTEDVYSGLSFEEMNASARKWVDYVKKNHNPDIIIGLFHSGLQGGITTNDYEENASMNVALNVPGFDAIMFGHDHQAHNSVVKCADGKDVVLLNPSNNARNAAELVITVSKKGDKLISKKVEGKLIDLTSEEVDSEFMNNFNDEIEEVKQWADRKIGVNLNEITTRDCFFGSSAFTDLVHNLQLKLTGAEISLSAPLTFNSTLKAGDITVSDMFKLYKYENKLYVMKLTGEEVRRILEMSYNLWVNTMTSPDDNIMKLSTYRHNGNERNGFINQTFNFDSAAGIDYVVDVTKPDGQKVQILQMSNGEPFDLNKTYRIAVNSYRGNGGGELLTKGAGIPKEQLESRIISQTELDQRWYLMEEIERQGTIAPVPNNNWRFVPDEWAIPAIKRDRALIFGEGK